MQKTDKSDKSEILRAMLRNPSARQAVIKLLFKRFRDIHITKHLKTGNKKVVRYADGTTWNNFGRKLAGPKRLIKRSSKKPREVKKLSKRELMEETKVINILFLSQNSETKNAIKQAQQVQFVDLAAKEEEEEKEHNRIMEEYEALMKRLKYQSEEEKKKNESPLKIYIQSLIKKIQ